MSNHSKIDRRDFLKQAAVALGAAAQPLAGAANAPHDTPQGKEQTSQPHSQIDYPRQFRGRALRMVAFPLGGVAAGSIALGGRGQLRDWEIFNRPNKGYRPQYAFPSIWASVGNEKPVARVLEARIQPPYEGQDGLGSANVPGLSRLDDAVFIGAYPFAHIDFSDRTLPVNVKLDAFSPFIPHEPDDSGLPVTILRYRVTNSNLQAAAVSIAFSIENPVQTDETGKTRVNEYRTDSGVHALLMRNPGLASDNPMSGTVALACLPGSDGEVSHWAGWPAGRWWNSPLLFWDRFSQEGTLGPEPDPHNNVGALCLQRQIAPGATSEFLFLIGWHFPNRTPEWCGWDAPSGKANVIIGNFCATRFHDALDAVLYTHNNLASLESRTRAFADALHASTLPAAVKDATSANLSTLATTTCFRTADGEFHGFEGSDDTRGCCFGNCTHVWNYETVTPYLFPSFAHSLRRSAFGYSMDDAGAMHFRQMLPDGDARWGFAAADGQMGQIVHAWLDWKLSGDNELLRSLWPRIKKALEFAWIPGGWDANKDGIFEGVQHNTYDVEFYGPNPMCSIYYLAALCACAEMAQAMGDAASSQEYSKLFAKGSAWIDANLFNGEYYIQHIRGFHKDQIAANLRSDMGSEDTETPQYQVGAGCFVDQLIGQYLADLGGMNSLVSADRIHTALQSMYRYNFKSDLSNHENVARTFALNHEAALIVCDYAGSQRPRIPFPYFSEVFNGLEYSVASVMIGRNMVQEGLELITSTRLRHDGEKRNPWDETECGHHYARAMSAWSTLVSLSGFRYDGVSNFVTAIPRLSLPQFQSIWATGNGWGTFTIETNAASTHLSLRVIEGILRLSSCEIDASGSNSSITFNGASLPHKLERAGSNCILRLVQPLTLAQKDAFSIEVRS